MTATSSRKITIDDLARIQVLSEAQISPDGARLIFVRKRIDEKNRYVMSLWSAEKGLPLKRLTQEEVGQSSGRYSFDGSKIAFISRREKSRGQIYILGAQGEAQRLTDLPEGAIGAFRWSPDGKTIAFTFRPELEERRAEAVEHRKANGLATPPMVVDNGWYRMDGDGYFGRERYAIHLVDVASGAIRKLYARSAQGLYTFEWTLDSQELVVSHSIQPNPWAMKIDERLFRVSVRDGSAREVTGAPSGRKYALALSPDGKRVAYIGHDSPDDFWGVYNNQLYVVPLEGGRAECLSADLDTCLSFTGLGDMRDAAIGVGLVQWSPDSKRIFLNWNDKGESVVGSIEVATCKLTRHWQGKAAYSVTSIAVDGTRAAGIIDDGTHPTEVAVLDLVAPGSEPKRITDVNAEFAAARDAIEPEEIWVKADDGHPVHAWVLKPKLKAGEKCAAAISVHGGPHVQYCWGYFHEFQALAAEGIAIVYPNPRGSKGYGQAHCSAIRGDWGNRDWADIRAITQWMKTQNWIDSSRLAIMGGSYGGYMTNWAIGHSQDYKAAITDRCVSNLLSMFGTSDFSINKDMLWPGSPFGGIEAIKELWKQSPLSYFENVKTPTLVIHSEGDLRCNIEQGEQVFAALQVLDVESRFVRYPRECNHGLSRGGPPDLRKHRLNEMLRWLKKHLS